MMKSSVLAAAAVASTLALTGCYGPRNVGGVSSLGVVETVPQQSGSDSDKGYVEFISVSRDVPVPVYQVDEKGNAYLLASIGLRAGDTYRSSTPGRTAYGPAPLVQNLRVSEPPGQHTFAVERNGERIEVPVKEGKITPVEVDYTLLQEGLAFRTYRVNYRVFEPVPYQEGRLSCAAPSGQESRSNRDDQRPR